MTGTVAPGPAPAPAVAGLRRRLAVLFPVTEPRPVGWRRIGLSAAAVAVGTGVSLGRTAGTGPFQSIWEEDARNLLTDALMYHGLWKMIKPYVGYFQLAPRLMAEVAGRLPVSWAAAVLSTEAAVTCALLAVAVYVASGAHLRHPLPRLLVAAPMLFAPVAENILAEIYNRPACVQFFLVYAVFWLILWAPRRRAARLLLVAVVAGAAVSTFLVVFFVPLAAVRLYTLRDRWSAGLLAALLGGAALQVSGLVFGLTDRGFEVPRYEPLWSLAGFAGWAVPHSMLGWRLANGTNEVFDRPWAVVVAWLLVLSAVALGLTRLTRPAWLLAGCAAAHCLVLCCFTTMANGLLTQRYLLPVELLLFTALVAVLLPGPGARRVAGYAPLAVLGVFVLVLGVANYRFTNTYRAHSPRWTDSVAAAARICRATGRPNITIRSGPEPWYSIVSVPCRDLM